MRSLSPYRPRGEGRLRMDQLSMFEKPRLSEFDKPSRHGSTTTTTTTTETNSSNPKPIGLSTEEMDLILQIAERHGKDICGGKNGPPKKSSNCLFPLHSSSPNLNYDPNEDDDDGNGNGDCNDSQKPFSTEEVQKPFSIEEELCSERKFMSRSKDRSKSISHAPSSNSSQGGGSILDNVNRPRQRSQSILGSTGQGLEKSSLNASAPNLSFAPFAVDSDDEEEDMDALLQAAKAMHKPRSKSLVEVPSQKKEENVKQRSQSLVVTKSLSDHMTKTPGKKKKRKRILVRASELGITGPPTDGPSLNGSIDSKEVEEAVKRWSSGLKDVPTRRKSVDGSISTNGSMIPQSPEKRRNPLHSSERRRSVSCHRSKSRARSSTADTVSSKESSNRSATPSRTRSKSTIRGVKGRSRSLPRVKNVTSSASNELKNGKQEAKNGNDDVGFVVKSRQSSKAGNHLEKDTSDESLEQTVPTTKGNLQAPKSPGASTVKSSTSERRSKTPSSRVMRRGLVRSKSAVLSTPTFLAAKLADDFDVLKLGIISKDQLQELKSAGFYIAES